MTDQLDLSPEFHWQSKGAMIRELLNRAIVANGISHADIAADTGIDDKQIGRSLREGGGAHPPLAVLAFVLWHDRLGIFIQGLAARLGYEARPKTPDLAEENRRLREQLARLRSALEDAP